MKISELDDDTLKNFLAFSSKIFRSDDKNFKFEQVTKGKKKEFDFDKLDMDFPLDGDFGEINSFKVGMGVLDFSPPKASTKSRESAFNELDKFDLDAVEPTRIKELNKVDGKRGVKSDPGDTEARDADDIVPPTDTTSNRGSTLLNGSDVHVENPPAPTGQDQTNPQSTGSDGAPPPPWMEDLVKGFARILRVERYWTAGVLVTVGVGLGGIMIFYLRRAEARWDTSLSSFDKALEVATQLMEEAKEAKSISVASDTATEMKKTAATFGQIGSKANEYFYLGAGGTVGSLFIGAVALCAIAFKAWR